MFKAIKLNFVYIFLFCFVCCLLFSARIARLTIKKDLPKTDYVVVIDAGHGGVDGGSVGIVTGNTENVLNLEYAKCLKQILEKNGIRVVMTRTTLDGLYDNNSENRKKDDMLKRKEIILKSKADLVVSIHMNSYPLKSCRGAQVFYNKESQNSQILAFSVQKIFSEELEFSKENAEIGDYYILNCSDIPSIIIECGFLSNPDEDRLLANTEYKQRFCYTIFKGLGKYLIS